MIHWSIESIELRLSQDRSEEGGRWARRLVPSRTQYTILNSHSSHSPHSLARPEPGVAASRTYLTSVAKTRARSDWLVIVMGDGHLRSFTTLNLEISTGWEWEWGRELCLKDRVPISNDSALSSSQEMLINGIRREWWNERGDGEESASISH